MRVCVRVCVRVRACAGKVEHSSTLQRPRLSSTKTLRISLLGYKDKITIENCKKIPRGDNKLVSRSPGEVFAFPCHPVAIAEEFFK